MTNQMTPNDKLPDETLKQIKSNAALVSGYKKDEDSTPQRSGYYFGYIAGATAWAPWKVKYDELKERGKNYSHDLIDRNDLLAHECQQLKEQAQRMADALEELISLKYLKEEEGKTNDYLQRQPGAWTKAIVSLQQFKDGGKEVGDEASLSAEEKKKLLAGKIESRIKERGLQRQQFAELMKVQPSSVTKWLSGEHNFEIHTLFEIEKQLNINLFNL